MNLVRIALYCITIFYSGIMQSWTAKLPEPDFTVCPTCCGPPPCCSPCISCDANYNFTGEFCDTEHQCLNGDICKTTDYYGICCKLSGH